MPFEGLRVPVFLVRALSFAAAATFLAAAGLAAQRSTIAPPSQWAPAPLLLMGPYVIDYVNPNDQPWSQSTFPYGY